MNRCLSLIFLLFSVALANAQGVQQSGSVTPGHVTAWTTNGVVQDGGTAAIPYLTSIGTYGNGPTQCASSSKTNIGVPYNQVCLGATAAGGTISFYNYAGANGTLSVDINGTNYPFPFLAAGVAGPVSSTVGDFATWNNTAGTLLADTPASAIIPAFGITRAEIPSTNLPASGHLTVTGFHTAGDLGAGAVYVFCGTGAGCSTSLEAIADANGNYWTLQLTNTVNVGWFGAYGDGTAHLISSADITTNPQWRGGYTTSWSWDSVALQEAWFAALAVNSIPNTNIIGSAFLANPQGANTGSGTGCTSGTQTFTVVGGTGTAATISGTVINGVLSEQQAPLTVVSGGSYSVFPTSPVTLSGGGCATPPTAVVEPSSIVWNSSPSTNQSLNRDIEIPTSAASNTLPYYINQPLIMVGAHFTMTAGAGTYLNWEGPLTATMWTCDSCSYYTFNRVWKQSTQAANYNTAAPLFRNVYNAEYPGLAPQNGVCNSCFISLSSNGRGDIFGPVQGSTFTYNNLECSGFASDYCVSDFGINAFNIVLNNSDIQGFTHNGVFAQGGTVAINDTTSENEQTTTPFTPVINQITTGGADTYINSGAYIANRSSIKGSDRSESDVGVICAGGFCDVQNYGLTHTSGLTWSPSSYYFQGDMLYSQPGCGGSPTSCVGTGYETFLVVDDGGNGSYPAAGSGSTATVISDPSASYTTNEWAPSGSTVFYLYYRYPNGVTSIEPITSNTATTITLSTALPYGVQTGSLYHIGGNTGTSTPNFDGASAGYSEYNLSHAAGYGFSTTAGSDSVTYAAYDGQPAITVGQYIAIPNSDCLGSSPIYAAMLIAKVTVASGGTLTINKNACYTQTDVEGFWGTALVDNQVSYIQLDYNAFGGNEGMTLLHSFTPSGGIIGVQSYNDFMSLQSNWQSARPDEPDQFHAPIGFNYDGPVSFYLGGPWLGTQDVITPASTIDLTNAIISTDYIQITPAQNETLNFPALSASSGRRIAISILTSGTTPYTITFGTNANSNGTLSTGSVSGASFVITFEWNGSKWQEVARSASAGNGSPLISGNNLSDVASASTARTNLDLAPSTGLAISGSNLLSNAENTNAFYPGPASSVSSTKGGFTKWVKASTVDNIEGSASAFVCSGNPTITFYECGTSTTCASSPTTIGTVTVTAAGTAADGSINSAAITAGDYTAWEISAGTCTSLDIAGMAQVHSN